MKIERNYDKMEMQTINIMIDSGAKMDLEDE